MFGYIGNPYAELDRSYYAKERADVQHEKCVEFTVDSFMIDCLEREDAATIINDHDLQESDLLVDLMVLAARAEGSSMSATDAVAHMARLMRAEFRKIAARECDK